jgi:phosphoglucosamine mutase
MVGQLLNVGPTERLNGSLACAVIAAMQGAQIIRVHDVKETVEALRVVEATLSRENVMSNRKYFGTDGIRGRVGDAPITPEFVLKLGWAAGKVLARHGSRKIIIGKDTRISAICWNRRWKLGWRRRALCSFGPMPTPAVAYLTRAFRGRRGLLFQLRITLSTTTASNSSPLRHQAAG